MDLLRKDHKVDPKQSLLPVYMQDLIPFNNRLKDGITGTATVVTEIGIEATVVKYKTITVTYTYGIVTAVSAESAWIEMTAI